MTPHLLIFGFGYAAQVIAIKARDLGFEVTGTTRNPNVLGDNSGVACQMIHFSEKSIEHALSTATHLLISTPPAHGLGDPVLLNCGSLLKKYKKNIQWLGYLSSTSVYGDHQGNWVDESSPPINLGEQGKLRLFAENQWVSFAKQLQLPLTIFRLAGIYGPQRNVLDRLKAGKEESIIKDGHFFSRIHVDDIALVVIAAIKNSKSDITIYNVADDKPTPSDVVDEYATLLLQHTPLRKVAYEGARLSPMLKEFYSHNKRVSNMKLKNELHIELAYPTYKEGLEQLFHQGDYKEIIK